MNLRYTGWTLFGVFFLLATYFVGCVHGKDDTDATKEKEAVEGGADDDVIIGIDLGTTYSCVAVMRGSYPVVIANEENSPTTASWVALPDSGDAVYVGAAAKIHSKSDPGHTFFDAKRIIGKIWKEVVDKIGKYPFKVVNKGGKPVFEASIKGKPVQYTPEEISAKVLIKMRQTAEAFLGRPIKSAVITVPAYFNDSQRQATKDAGAIAGLNVRRIINEPTAAAIAYGMDKKGSKKILVFDLGGGTFDVSILEFDDGVFEVKAVNGNTYLGGQDFDERIIDWAAGIAKDKYGVDIKANDRLLNKFRSEAEKAKIALSSLPRITFEVDGLGPEGKTFSEPLTRAKFEDLNKDLFAKCLPPVEAALKDAKLQKSQIDEILLVGGSTRIPKVQQLIQDLFNGKQLNKSINPDEAVALGAALQGAILTGHRSVDNLLVIDAAPLSLGIQTVNDVFVPLIPRNTAIPTRKSQIFSTAEANQTRVVIQVFEGERKFTADNHFLGKFELEGIPLAPKGVPKIEVTFDLDANGILNVSAKDLGSGNQQSVKISNDKGRLSKEEIERMVQDAEKFQEEDERRRATLDARDKFEQYLEALKSQLDDEKGLGGKISDSDRREVLTIESESRAWLVRNSGEATKEDYEEQQARLERIVGPIVSKMYGEAGASGAGGEQEARDEL